MSAQTSVRLRELLLKHPKGLSVHSISQKLELDYYNITKRLNGTYGCYVMRWEGQRQIWGCVRVPANAIRPTKETALDRVSRAEPITQDVFDTPYKPQKTLWQRVQPWPKEPE